VRPGLLKLLLNIYPPYWGSGIKVSYVAGDLREIKVRMKLRFYNRNYVGTHFGGSLYAMTDPFYMLMLMYNLGRGYRIWDKAASVDFISPGRGTVRAHFTLTEEQLEDIRSRTAGGEKYLPVFTVDVRDEEDNTVARVEKTIYVRAKSSFS
jgi:acyl-coenzyme A thioesterase PaaI-like protein